MKMLSLDPSRFLYWCVIFIVSHTGLIACDDGNPSVTYEPTDELNMIGGMIDASTEEPPLVGGSAGGAELVGGVTAGTQIGGEEVTGADTAGTENAGTIMAGAMIAGEIIGGMEEIEDDCSTTEDWTPRQQIGSVYLTHFLTNEVINYRIDGQYPIEFGRFSVGGEPHDASLNAEENLYAVALNITQEVELYALPERLTDTFEAPTLLNTINTAPYTPRRVFFDPARSRLFVFSNAPLDDGLLAEMYLSIYDVSNPSLPVALADEPFQMPVSTTLAVEPRAGILALVELSTYHLYLYDVSGSTPTLHEGEPIDLLEAFPEPGGQDAFQVRNLRFDPLVGRLYMARGQSIASEVIAYKYEPVEVKPEGSQDMPSTPSCSPAFTYSDLLHIPDDFDVSVPIAERAHLLGGFMALPLIGEEFLLFINYAWRTNSIASMVSLMRDSGEFIENLTACGDYEDFGCYYTSYFGGMPSNYNHLTDGAGCVDQKFNVFAGVGLEDDENSSLFLFKIDRETGMMSPWLTDNGRNLSTASYPLVLSCY